MTARSLPLLLVALLIPDSGCSCNGNGHVPHTPFVARPGDDVINCACNVTLAHPRCDNGVCFANFQVQLCMPLALQMHPDLGPAPPDGGADPFARRVDDYCRHDVTNIAYHLIKVFNGGWCEFKAPFAPDGGAGQSVECFAHEVTPGRGDATTHDDGTCLFACPETVCSYELNCGEGVQDAEGNIHIDKCRCNQVRTSGCPGDPPSDLPTSVFCRPPDPKAPQ